LNSDLQSFIGLIVLALTLCIVLLLGFFGIPIAIVIGLFVWRWKKNQQRKVEEELQTLRRKVEAVDGMSETDFRNAVHDKLHQDLYLDEAIGEIYEWENVAAAPNFPEAGTPIEIGRYKDQAAHFLNNHDYSNLVSAVANAVRSLVIRPVRGMFEATRPLKLEEVQYLSQEFDHPRYFKKLYKRLTSNLEDAKEVDDYIRDTPFELIRERPVSNDIKAPFEHCHILGTTGAGKTQLMQYIISKRLEEDCCVIVIDNQRQMIPKLARLGLDMQYISPHYPLAMNLFDMPQDENTAPLLRYVLSAMMNAPLTAKQQIVFQFVTTAVLHHKGNIDTFHSILEGESFDFSGLDPTTRRFFETEYYTKGNAGYENTRNEISWRVWALLTNPVLRDMFLARDNKVALETDRKLILIDCDIDKLKDYTGLFGRFFLAQLVQLAHHRFQGEHRPIHVFIDEFYYYVDQSLATMLETARKAKIGLTFANHHMAQIRDPDIAVAVLGFPSTRFASNINVADLPALSKAMRCDGDFIQSQKRLHMAMSQRSEEPVSIRIEPGVIEGMAIHDVPHEEMKRRYGRDDPDPPSPPPNEPSGPQPTATGEGMSTHEDNDIQPTSEL